MKNNNTALCGVLNIYKEKGFTSHDVVNVVRKTLGRVKTGHTGTLDPEAEGVLPVCVGKATKLADYVAASVKVYKAEITLGITTTTEDHTGEVLETKEVSVTLEDLTAAAQAFVGEYYQKPPMYSAIKVNGKKLYELAREGKEVERKTRLIHIYAIEDIRMLGDNRAEMVVTCSKGTYIRTLCKDIGERLGCGAHMSALLRCASGAFKLDTAIRLDELKALVAEDKLSAVLLPPEKVLDGYKRVNVSSAAQKFLDNGNKISLNYCSPKPQEGETVIVYDENNILVGVYMVAEDFIKPVTMLK
jgi:tRNA pseudouridine55 synthase